MEYKFEIHCCLCSNEHTAKVDLPDGWTSQYESASEEFALCPQHSGIKEFIDSQCPGCVGGWGDCGLWKSFAYTGRRDLISTDFESIRKGVCPRRVNGSFSFSREEGFRNIDLTSSPNSKAGEALEVAIKEYWDRYPS